MIKTPWIDQY